jgi:hypothetical protein
MVCKRFVSGVLIAAAVSAGFLCGTAARAADAVENPKYHAWSKFKAGSNETLAADVEAGPQKMHVEVTRTLVSITADEAVVESKTKIDIMGHSHESPGRQETIKATSDKEEVTQTGEETIDAMGKTFKCKVYESKGKTDAPAAPAGPGAAAGNPDGPKGTVWASDDVPGGVVKIASTGRNGKAVTFILTGMESK